MKLVELLARELKVWPNGAAITQDYDGDMGLYAISDPKLVNGDENDAVWHFSGHMRNLEPLSSVATDHATAIVTRADWEAEVARLAKPEWIRHRGGKCPVEAGFLIDVRHRDGCIGTRCNPFSGKWDWRHSGHETDIMAYRICEPEQASDAVVEHDIYADDTEPSVSPVLVTYTDQENPLTWRDRIREIDITVEALEEERAGLVQQLEDEGFQLIVL